MGLPRLIAIVTLVIFTINLGDWPYTDEILVELNEQAQSFRAELTGICIASNDDNGGGGSTHRGLDFQSQLSLQNVTPPSDSMWSARSDLSQALFEKLLVMRLDFVWDDLLRPPAA